MNAFDSAKKIELRAMEDVLPWIGLMSLSGQFVLTEKGRLSKELQKVAGDILYNRKSDGALLCCELKAEEENKYGNFYLETWSNRSRFNLGWMFKLDSDILLYYFLEEKDLYVINFVKLRKWAFGANGNAGRIYAFPEKPQNKRAQLNDTWGRCVPVSVIENEVGFHHFSLKTKEE